MEGIIKGIAAAFTYDMITSLTLLPIMERYDKILDTKGDKDFYYRYAETGMYYKYDMTESYRRGKIYHHNYKELKTLSECGNCLNFIKDLNCYKYKHEKILENKTCVVEPKHINHLRFPIIIVKRTLDRNDMTKQEFYEDKVLKGYYRFIYELTKLMSIFVMRSSRDFPFMNSKDTRNIYLFTPKELKYKKLDNNFTLLYKDDKFEDAKVIVLEEDKDGKFNYNYSHLEDYQDLSESIQNRIMLSNNVLFEKFFIGGRRF